MLVYLFTGGISLIFAYLSQRTMRADKFLPAYPETNYTALHTVRVKRHFRFISQGKLTISTERFFAFLSFLPLFTVSAIRYMVGTDYAGTYKDVYTYIFRDGYHFHITGEPLYALLNRIAIIYSGSDYVGVFALSSLLVCGFIFWGIRIQSVNFLYSVLLFIISGVYFWSFNGIRQSIAMAIFIFALQFILKNKPKKYLICILIAAGFHKMALIYIPIYFLKNVRLSFKTIFITVAAVGCFSNIFVKIIYNIAAALPVFNIYVVRYLNNSKFDSFTESSSSHAFINLAFILLFIIIANIYDKHQTKCNLWMNLQLLALLFALLSSVLPLANRISRLFEVVQIISIPNMTRLITDKKLRIIINVAIIVCFCIYTFVTFFILGYHNVFPYQTIFSR